jgi:hypothetical protein
MKLKSKDTVMALANTIELGACVVRELAGKDVADSIGSNKASVDALARLISARIQARFSKYTSQPIK